MVYNDSWYLYFTKGLNVRYLQNKELIRLVEFGDEFNLSSELFNQTGKQLKPQLDDKLYYPLYDQLFELYWQLTVKFMFINK